jgi:hypothetical protein
MFEKAAILSLSLSLSQNQNEQRKERILDPWLQRIFALVAVNGLNHQSARTPT